MCGKIVNIKKIENISETMAQSKLNDLAGKFGKGGPPGLGIGLKLLGVAGALAYGVTQSVYTGKLWILKWNFLNIAAHVTSGKF